MEKYLLLPTQVRGALWRVICKNDAVLTGASGQFLSFCFFETGFLCALEFSL